MSHDEPRNVVRVLVAEDDVHVRLLLQKTLEREGYEVAMAANGREARELLERREPDVLVTDIGMPELGGMELIRWTRQTLPQVRIMAITGLDTPELVTACLELGALRCLAKPFTPDKLLRALAQIAGAPGGR